MGFHVRYLIECISVKRLKLLQGLGESKWEFRRNVGGLREKLFYQKIKVELNQDFVR
jgi:hypothetical protein